MPTIRFTQNIQRHVPCPDMHLEADTVREALDRYFEHHPKARGYVLDDQSMLRKHMAIFINSEPLLDRENLDQPLDANSKVDVIQALSGG